MPNHNPTERAQVLVEETLLPAHEIAKMTGLDVYQSFRYEVKSQNIIEYMNQWSSGFLNGLEKSLYQSTWPVKKRV